MIDMHKAWRSGQEGKKGKRSEKEREESGEGVVAPGMRHSYALGDLLLVTSSCEQTSQSISQSINHSVTHARCNPSQSPVLCSSSSSERSIKHLVSSRLACDQELDSIDCQQIINRRRGRVASSAAPSPTLSHHQNCRSSVRSCRPSHLTDTPHLFDWAISVSSYDSYHPPPSLMTSSACRPPLSDSSTHHQDAPRQCHAANDLP